MMAAMAAVRAAELEEPLHGKQVRRSRATAPSLAGLPTLGLDDRGVIRHCCPAGEALFGYAADELEGLHISALVPQLNDALVQDERINSRLAFLCRCAFSFQMQRRDGQKFLSQLFINRLGAQNVVVLVRRLDGQ